MNPLYALLIVVLAFLVGTQLVPLLRARALRGQPAPSLEGVTDDPDARRKGVLIYFWSPQCGACRGLSTLLDRLAEEGRPVAKIDVTVAPAIARRFKVMVTPTLIRVRAGRIDAVLLGAQPERRVRELLEALEE